MTLNINGVTVELPNDVNVEMSEDGKRVKITTKPVEAVEKIRFVEAPGEVVERIRVIERIVEVEKPCTRPHYYPTVHPTWPNTYPWGTSGGSGGVTWTATSTIVK